MPKAFQREMEQIKGKLHLLEPQIADVIESGDVLTELTDAWITAGEDQAARRKFLLSLLQNVDALAGLIVK